MISMCSTVGEKELMCAWLNFSPVIPPVRGDCVSSSQCVCVCVGSSSMRSSHRALLCSSSVVFGVPSFDSDAKYYICRDLLQIFSWGIFNQRLFSASYLPQKSK